MKTPRFPLTGYLVALLLCLASFISGHAASVLLDFSSQAPGRPANGIDTLTGYYWNSITVGTDATFSGTTLLASDQGVSGLSLSAFYVPVSGGSNGTGATTSTLFSSWISSDSLFLNSTTATISMSISGLVGGQGYDLVFYGSRLSSAAPRTSIFTATSGASSGTTTLDCTNNIDTTATISLIADASGIATITLGCTSPTDFAYLGALQIVSAPEPSAAALGLLGGMAGLFRALHTRRGRKESKILLA